MPLFSPIEVEADLPPEGGGRESLVFDVKKEADRQDQAELAKDIAAFANAIGGVVLVGAAEDRRRGTIGRYFPLPEAEAKLVRDAYSQAARDRCFPKPVVSPVVILREAGFVVAVNVWAFPGQPVGVELPCAEPAGSRAHKPRVFGFPMRTAVDTVWLSPEQLPMFMSPEIRRIAIHLGQIPEDSKVVLLMDKAPPNLGQVWQQPCVFKGIDLLGNRLHLRPEGSSDDLCVPLDGIHTAWQPVNAPWQIAVKGRFDRSNNRWTYFPTARA